MRHLTRTARPAAVLAATALLATGCGLGSTNVDAQTASSGSDAVAPEADDTATDDATVSEKADHGDAVRPLDEPDEEPVDGAGDDVEETAGELPSGTTIPTDGPSEPIAAIDGTAPFDRVEILDLRRSGDTVTLDFVIEVSEGAGGERGTSDRFAGGPDLFGPLSDEGEAGPSDARRRAVSGVTLIDHDNANRHLVLRDSSGQCLCTRFPDGLASENSRNRHSAQFPAPPADVTSMTVEIPTFPAIDGVPLRDAG